MTETSLPLTPPSTKIRANSMGEELYFVHLQRMTAPDPHPEDAEDDHDYEAARHPKKQLAKSYLKSTSRGPRVSSQTMMWILMLKV